MSAADTIIGYLKQIKDAIGGEPPDEDVLEIVKKALEQKLANKEKPFVDLLYNEFYNWLRTTFSEEKVQSVNALEKASLIAFLIGVRNLPSPVIVNLKQVEAIAEETVKPPVKKFASERNAYTTSLFVIKRIINEALLNPGVSEEVFTQKKDERIEEFDTIGLAKAKSFAYGGGAGGSAASGGGGGGGGNARARRRGLKSRRRNRKQRKTRKQK